jgi:hypothetical protein
LTAIDFIRIFLGEIFFTVLAVLVILGTILITSLLLADAEEKTFEYGILRTLGLKQAYIILILVFQSLLFSVPGVLLGLLASYLVYIPIGYVIATYTGADFDMTMDSTALVIGILLGILLPFIVSCLSACRSLLNSHSLGHGAAYSPSLDENDPRRFGRLSQRRFRYPGTNQEIGRNWRKPYCHHPQHYFGCCRVLGVLPNPTVFHL